MKIKKQISTLTRRSAIDSSDQESRNDALTYTQGALSRRVLGVSEPEAAVSHFTPSGRTCCQSPPTRPPPHYTAEKTPQSRAAPIEASGLQERAVSL